MTKAEQLIVNRGVKKAFWMGFFYGGCVAVFISAALIPSIAGAL